MMRHNFEILHWGFDALYIAFQGSVSDVTRRALNVAKTSAMAAGEPVFARIAGLAGHVADTGATGGYRYRFEQGPLAAKWLFKENADPNEWNLWAEVPASALAEFGVMRCVYHLREDLEKMDSRIKNEAVNRFDICVDINSDGFIPSPKNLSVHSHTRVKQHFGDDEHDARKLEVVGAGKNIQTITIGKMPGKQISIYDKRREATYSQKSVWWEIWGKKKEELTQPVWRVELRFGKTALRAVGVETIDDVLAKGGDMILKAMRSCRYLVTENTDEKRSRDTPDHYFWTFAKKALSEFSGGPAEGANTGKIKRVIRDDHINLLEKQALGLLKTLSALRGIELPEGAGKLKTPERSFSVDLLLSGLRYRLSELDGEEWGDFEDGIDDARAKYHYITEEEKGRHVQARAAEMREIYGTIENKNERMKA